MEDRVLELEERAAYESKRISELDEVVIAFTRRVETLERQLTALRRELQEVKASEPLEPHDTKPPHY